MVLRASLSVATSSQTVDLKKADVLESLLTTITIFPTVSLAKEQFVPVVSRVVSLHSVLELKLSLLLVPLSLHSSSHSHDFFRLLGTNNSGSSLGMKQMFFTFFTMMFFFACCLKLAPISAHISSVLHGWLCRE